MARAIGIPMKLRASRIERMLAKVEAALVPPPRKCLRVIIHDGDDETEAKENALAQHIAAHPEDAGRTVQDFNWILRTSPSLNGRYETGRETAGRAF
jgi:hypothetical protein